MSNLLRLADYRKPSPRPAIPPPPPLSVTSGHHNGARYVWLHIGQSRHALSVTSARTLAELLQNARVFPIPQTALGGLVINSTRRCVEIDSPHIGVIRLSPAQATELTVAISRAVARSELRVIQGGVK